MRCINLRIMCSSHNHANMWHRPNRVMPYVCACRGGKNGRHFNQRLRRVRQLCKGAGYLSGLLLRLKKVQMFGLFEVKRKVRVVWIPTVTLNTKYAVACTKCKSGIYVEDRILNAVLANRAELVFDSNGEISISEIPGSQFQAPVKTQQQEMSKRSAASADVPRPDPVLSQATESVQGSSSSLQNVELAREGVPSLVQRKKVCPRCGLMYVSSKEQCDVCGSALV